MNEKEKPTSSVYLYGYIFIFWIICLLFPAINIGYADDSVRWAYHLRYTEGLINSHHLIFDILRYFYNASTSFFELSPYRFISAYAATWGAIGLLSVYKIFSTLETTKSPDAFFAVILCSVFYSYFAYSMVADVYVPTISSLLIATYFTINSLRLNAQNHTINIILAAVFFYLAILHHQAFFIFITGIFFWGLYLALRAEHRSQSLSLIKITFLSGLISLVTYFAFYLTFKGSNESFLVFVSGYAEKFTAYPDMKSLTFTSLIKAGSGLGRALLNLNQLFYFDAFAQAIQSKFPYRHVFASVFAIKSVPQLLVLCSLITTIIALIAMLLKLPSSLKGFITNKPLISIFLFCVLPQMFFFIWWEAISDEFWIWLVPFVAMFFALSTSNSGYQYYLRIILVVSIGFTTLIAFYIPATSKDANIDSLNYSFINELKEGDVLVSFDEIVMANRLNMLSRENGFVYINLKKARTELSSSEQYKDLLLNLEQTKIGNNQFIIGPYLLQPPKSYRQLVKLVYPEFFFDWKDELDQLKQTYPHMKLIYPSHTLEGYFIDPL